MKLALRPSNAKRLKMDEKSTAIGEIKEQKNRKVKRKIRLLLLCLTSILQPV